MGGHQKSYLLFRYVSAVHYSADLTGAQNEYSVAKVYENVEVFAHVDNGCPFLLLFVQKIIYRVRTVDVEPAHRIRRHEHRRRRRYLAPYEHLLHVAAREPSHRRVRRRRNDFELLYYLVGKVLRILPVEEHKRSLAVGTEHHIVDNVHIPDEPHSEPVLRYEGKPYAQIAYLHGRLLLEVHLCVVFVGVEIEYVATFRLLQAGYRFEQLSLPASRYARDTEYLSRTRGEGHVVERFHAVAVHYRQLFDRETVHAAYGLRALDIERYLLTHHHFGELFFVGFGGFDGRDVLALTQHSHSVGYRHDFVKFMGYYYQRLAVRFHRAHDVEKFFRLLRRQHRRRLVKNKNIRPSVQNFYNLDSLLFTHGHVVYFLL